MYHLDFKSAGETNKVNNDSGPLVIQVSQLLVTPTASCHANPAVNIAVEKQNQTDFSHSSYDDLSNTGVTVRAVVFATWT